MSDPVEPTTNEPMRKKTIRLTPGITTTAPYPVEPTTNDREKALLREQRKEYEQMPLAELFTSYRDGQEIGWEVEFAELREREGAYLERLAASIHKNGMHTPILLGKDGRIWDGHHRLYVARLLGMATVPVIRASVNIPDAPAGKPVVSREALIDMLHKTREFRALHLEVDASIITNVIEGVADALLASGLFESRDEQLVRAINTVLPGLKARAYAEDWVDESPAMQAIAILNKYAESLEVPAHD